MRWQSRWAQFHRHHNGHQLTTTPAAKPVANVTKVTPQNTANTLAAGKAASQEKPAPKVAEDAKNGGEKK
jgi:hypothetical protein